MCKMSGFVRIYWQFENTFQSTSVSQESDENTQYHQGCINKWEMVFPSEELERITGHYFFSSV